MNDRHGSPQSDFNNLYSDVSRSIANATAEIDRLEVEHRNGKQELGNILGRLQGIQARFDEELHLLETHAEWEKFTIAFFGETNAGKSTLIESLRIFFDEESRRQLLEKNAGDVDRYEQELGRNVEAVRDGLLQAHAAVASDVAAARGEAEVRTEALLAEYAARSTAFRQELDVLERALREEAADRRELQQALERAHDEAESERKRFGETLARMRRQLWLAAAGGCVLGAAVLGLFALAWK